MFRPQREIASAKIELIGLGQPLAPEFAGEQFGVLDDRRLQPSIAVLPDESGEPIFEMSQRRPIVR